MTDEKPENAPPPSILDEKPVVRRSYSFEKRKDVADRVLKSWQEFKSAQALPDKKAR